MYHPVVAKSHEHVQSDINWRICKRDLHLPWSYFRSIVRGPADMRPVCEQSSNTRVYNETLMLRMFSKPG